jgi:hypothetical protein
MDHGDKIITRNKKQFMKKSKFIDYAVLMAARSRGRRRKQRKEQTIALLMAVLSEGLRA